MNREDNNLDSKMIKSSSKELRAVLEKHWKKKTEEEKPFKSDFKKKMKTASNSYKSIMDIYDLLTETYDKLLKKSKK